MAKLSLFIGVCIFAQCLTTLPAVASQHPAVLDTDTLNKSHTQPLSDKQLHKLLDNRLVIFQNLNDKIKFKSTYYFSPEDINFREDDSDEDKSAAEIHWTVKNSTIREEIFYGGDRSSIIRNYSIYKSDNTLYVCDYHGDGKCQDIIVSSTSTDQPQ